MGHVFTASVRHLESNGPVTQSTQNDADVKELVRQHWNGRAATFDDASQHGIHTDDQRERWLEVLREWAGDGPRRVLDAGCGTGVVSLLLAELGHEVTGIDFAPAMLERARGKTRQAAIGRSLAATGSPAFVRGDVETLPVADDAVDLVTARHLVWTLPNPAAALAEWQRALEPGGRVVLLEGYWDHDEPWDEYAEIHADLPMYHGRPPAELREVLAQAGYRNIDHEPLLDPVLWGREPRHEYYVTSGTVPR